MIARLRDRRSSLSAIVPQSRGCSRWPRHWQTEQVTGQMATWREWRAWRREFKSLGIRQVKEREARSIWHQEKQQAARWWLHEAAVRLLCPSQTDLHHENIERMIGN